MRTQAFRQMEGPNLIGIVLGCDVAGLVDNAKVAVDVDRLRGVLDESTDDPIISALVAVAHELVYALLDGREVVLAQTRSTELLLNNGFEGSGTLRIHGKTAGLGHLLEHDDALALASRNQRGGFAGGTATDNDEIVFNIKSSHVSLLTGSPCSPLRPARAQL